jgi:DNA mismatch repair protein MutL
MARINVLPSALASQIAAGEVVERPASAAKELIENSLDAECSRCDVSCGGGGVTFLSVSDDGYGMSEADAARSVERHATSKISAISDLGQLSTFGFRGEALPSIASVSRFSMRTRPKDSDYGCCVEIEAAKPPVVRREGMPVGTTVVVRDLFFNVPARRKFLRSTGTESAHVTSVVEGAALSRPDVTFTLERDARKVRELLRVGSRRERVMQILGDESLAEVTGERGPVRLEAHLSEPDRARPGAAGLWLLVNGRVVRDRMIAATIAQAYGSVLKSGCYPRGVAYLDLACELVDVNVHPQKAEVRFVDPRALSDAIYSMVSRAVTTAFALPPATRGARHNQPRDAAASTANLLPVERGFIPGRDRDAPANKPADTLDLSAPNRYRADEMPTVPWNPNDLVVREASPQSRSPEGLEEPAPPTMLTSPADVTLGTVIGQPNAERVSDAPLGAVMGQLGTERVREPQAQTRDAPRSWGKLRFLAQVRLTYLVCEDKDGLYVIDQHSAAERVAFAKLLAQYKARSMASQALLFPVMIELLPKEIELVETQIETFGALGLDLRIRGQDRASVHSIPRLLQRASPERLVRDLLSELGRQGGRGFSSAVEQAIALMACHGSLRAGEALTAQQAQALLGSLDEVDITTHCTHGRPIVAVTRFTDLERQVGRR